MVFSIVQIVRRFGRVGGMETYVWNLAHGLAAHGHRVSIICEHVAEESSANIDIFVVDSNDQRHRWRAMLAFRKNVAELVARKFANKMFLIHSHERSCSHHITTFHGPPIASQGPLSWLQYFNRRISAWIDMERTEILGGSVKAVLPVSRLICKELEARYPDLKEKKTWVAWPGYGSITSRETLPIPKKKKGRTASFRFLFVGKEWKRKGLDKAIRVLDEFNKGKGTATLTVFGPDPINLPRHIRGKPGVLVKGWSSEINWQEFDLLMHPARIEPFGMVVSEARAHGLPVVISTRVGAVDLQFDSLAVVDFAESDFCWAREIERLLFIQTSSSELKWSWDDLVALHLNEIYPFVAQCVSGMSPK